MLYLRLPVLMFVLMAGMDLAAAPHRPHTHGSAKLYAVQEGDRLHLELESPAMAIVGFEQALRTEQQKTLLSAARDRLRAGATLFRFQGSSCTLDGAEITLPHEYAKEAVDHHLEESEAAHFDVKAAYLFNCKNPEQLRAFRVHLPEQFPDLKTFDVQWVVGGRQGATQVTRADPVLRLR